MKNITTIILWTISITMWLFIVYDIGRKNTPTETKMMYYELGYGNGYYNAKNKKGYFAQKDDHEIFITSHTDYDTVRILDSLRVVKILNN